jgi:putative ABC transport system substrate-binding protein
LWDTSISDVGQRAGIFKKHGVTLEILYTQGSGETQQAVFAGSVDIGVSVGVMGNLTGVNSFIAELGAKQLGLLHELAPGAVTIGMLVNPGNINGELEITEIQAAARAIQQQLRIFDARTEPDIDSAYATLAQQRADALVVANDGFFLARVDRLVALSARYAIPAVYARREYAEAGGLMSYGSSQTEAYRQVGIYAGRILKGAKPADLPVVQSIKFELVINLKTAKALGITVPPTLLARTDEVIE